MTFHLVARVNRNAPAGRIDNSTDETPGVEPPEPPLGPPIPPVVPAPPVMPSLPPGATPDAPGHITQPTPKPEAEAGVDVVRPSVKPPPPAVTG
ncbi:MAG: hypothetical protein JO168_14050 [Solirubrobacterales bacterium]|nr:hypothetical protein [Solirubrobacterales bacterium]